MKVAFAAAVLALAAGMVEIVVPGRALYHLGWYNVAIAAVAIVGLAAARRAARTAATRARRVAAVAIAGATLVGSIAVVASGLFAPDNHTVVAAPGETLVESAFGVHLAFPPLDAGGVPPTTVTADGRTIAGRGVDLGSVVARVVLRRVVAVRAFDRRGAALTVTQPSGSSFLSPILLMQAHQTIDGLDLPYDAFAVPPAQRSVRAVLFSPAQAALMRTMTPNNHGAVLLEVNDDRDRPLPHGIALVPSGETRSVGGLRVHVTVLRYPAVRLMAAPSAWALGLAAALAVLAGAVIARDARGTRAAADKGPAA